MHERVYRKFHIYVNKELITKLQVLYYIVGETEKKSPKPTMST